MLRYIFRYRWLTFSFIFLLVLAALFCVWTLHDLGSFKKRLSITDDINLQDDMSQKAPWETSERGSFITDELGDGTKTESTFSYAFPSGSMHTGDFLITAVIYRWSDMSQYEETYTETVSLE